MTKQTTTPEATAALAAARKTRSVTVTMTMNEADQIGLALRQQLQSDEANWDFGGLAYMFCGITAEEFEARKLAPEAA